MNQRPTDGREPAHPLPVAASENGGLESSIDWLAGAGGLTKREMFAAMAMQGYIAQGEANNEVAYKAVKMADRLIARLNAIRPDDELGV